MKILQWGKEYTNFKELEKDLPAISRNPYKLYYRVKDNIYAVGISTENSNYTNKLDRDDIPNYWYEEGKFDDYDWDKSDEIDLLFTLINDRKKSKYRFVGCFKLEKREKLENKYEKRIWKKISDDFDIDNKKIL